MTLDLALLSAGVAGLAVTLYVLLDGFDLGVGVLLLTTQDTRLRNQLVDTIAPTWDGNETWLIMAGVVLLGAFPVAYGILLPAFYLPLLIMLIALGCRGVSFEFRVQPGAWTQVWDRAFAWGSGMAAFCQGIVVGAALQGVRVEEGHFAGSVLDLLRPYPLLLGITLLMGYITLGATWVHFRTSGALHRHAKRLLHAFLPLFAVLGLLAVGFAPAAQDEIGTRWEMHGHAFVLLTLAFLLALVLAYRALHRPPDAAPFAYTIGAFLIGIAGLVAVIFPNIIPFRVSLWEAAAPRGSQLFLLIGVIFVMPVVLGYSYFAYHVFRGKVEADAY
jgi:cytochrome d ubiquinol oxidase subunit II